jgi:two-component system chemotaxis sensor kinase CheA
VLAAQLDIAAGPACRRRRSRAARRPRFPSPGQDDGEPADSGSRQGADPDADPDAGADADAAGRIRVHGRSIDAIRAHAEALLPVELKLRHHVEELRALAAGMAARRRDQEGAGDAA